MSRIYLDAKLLNSLLCKNLQWLLVMEEKVVMFMIQCSCDYFWPELQDWDLPVGRSRWAALVLSPRGQTASRPPPPECALTEEH